MKGAFINMINKSRSSCLPGNGPFPMSSKKLAKGAELIKNHDSLLPTLTIAA